MKLKLLDEKFGRNQTFIQHVFSSFLNSAFGKTCPTFHLTPEIIDVGHVWPMLNIFRSLNSLPLVGYLSGRDWIFKTATGEARLRVSWASNMLSLNTYSEVWKVHWILKMLLDALLKYIYSRSWANVLTPNLEPIMNMRLKTGKIYWP